MCNHSIKPTCTHKIVGGCYIVYALSDIAPGNELTMLYHEDERILQRRWGIAFRTSLGKPMKNRAQISAIGFGRYFTFRLLNLGL
jgi:hypothetical protein